MDEIDHICWQAAPCQYSDYKKDKNDPYEGEIFGRLYFDSPHSFYRKFHRNYCKSLMISNLKNYEMTDDDKYGIIRQVIDISKQFNLQEIARHNSLVLLIGSLESYLKDCFKAILENVYPDKMYGKPSELIIRRYSFQNIDSITKAYVWLCPDFKKDEIYSDFGEELIEKIDMYPFLNEMLNRRHKIVHESFFYQDLDSNRLMFYAYLCNSLGDKFDWFFEDQGYYKKIEIFKERPEIRDNNINCPKCNSIDLSLYDEKTKKDDCYEWNCKDCGYKWKRKISKR